MAHRGYIRATQKENVVYMGVNRRVHIGYTRSTEGVHTGTYVINKVNSGYIEVHTGYMGDTQGHIEGT